VSLDDKIRSAAESGAAGFTIWPTPDGRWQAGVLRGDGWRVRIASGPTNALDQALADEPEALTQDEGIFG